MARHLFAIACALLLPASTALAAGKSMTLYLDGALVEQEVTARKGYLEVLLPAAMQSGSFRVKPVGATRIQRVQVVPRKVEKGVETQLAALAERKELLRDRLRALESREDIFKAAAKSQSGKAPRKTKTNPEPLRTIRQGTDFALAQLEGVYTTRRVTEKELKSLDGRIAALRRQENVGGSIARVWVTGGQTVLARYVVPEPVWTPRYTLRSMDQGQVELALLPQLPSLGSGEKVSLVALPLAEAGAGVAPVSPVDGAAPLATYRLPVQAQHYGTGPLPTWTLTLRNSTGSRLPAGELTCFHDGEYLGQSNFPGSLPDQTTELSCGH